MATFGFDENKNKKEVYTREEVLSILQQAIDDQSLEDIDPSIVPTPAKIKEIRNNNTVAFWVGTEAQFEALGVNVGYCIARIDNNKNVYIIIDDSALDSINAELQQAAQRDTEWQTNTPRLFNDTGVHSTPTNNYTDYENAKIGDLLINSTGLYFCRILNVSTNFIEWLRIYDFRNEMPNFYKENSATPSTDPADYANLKLGDFVYTNNNILYFCNALSAQYCGWAKIIRPVDLLTKQDVLTAGDNIDITNNVISATAPKFELIKIIDISQLSEPTNEFIINENDDGDAINYDDIFIEYMQTATAETNSYLRIRFYGDQHNYFGHIINNFFTTTTRTTRNICERLTEKSFKLDTFGAITNVIGGTMSISNFDYNNKINKIEIYASSNFASGTINIYGRKKY